MNMFFLTKENGNVLSHVLVCFSCDLSVKGRLLNLSFLLGEVV